MLIKVGSADGERSGWTVDPMAGGVCDISDLVQPRHVSISRNIEIAESNYRLVKKITAVGAIAGAIGGAGAGAGAAAGHAKWFYDTVNTGGAWDYKSQTSELRPDGATIWEPFGNFHYGVVGAAAGFNRGNTLQRMAGLQQETHDFAANLPVNGGDHGGYASIIADFAVGRAGGTYPYRDAVADQSLIERGISYYNAGCHKK